MSKKLFFDIEAGGLFGDRSSILSIAYGEEGTGVRSLYAQPIPKAWLSRWSEENVWSHIKRQPNIQTEKEILAKFLTTLESQEAGTTLVGYNSGYAARAQRYGERLLGFDISMLITRASKYGMGEQYQAAIKQLTVRDVGAEAAFRVAREVATHGEGIVMPELFQQAKGYMKLAGKEAEGLGLRLTTQAASEVSEIARATAQTGAKFSGWRQEMVSGLLGLPQFRAHDAAEDVRALQRIEQNLESIQGRSFVREWNKEAVRNHLINRARYGARLGEEVPEEFMGKLRGIGAKYGVEWEAAAQRRVVESGGDWQRALRGLGMGQEGGRRFLAKEFVPGAPKVLGSMLERVGAAIAANKGKAGIIGGLALAYSLGPLSLFSGKDDNYNTIEALPHRGTAGRLRRQMTDFGSGYRGLPTHLMDQPIEQKILEFRARVIEDKQARADMEEELRVRQREATARLSQLTDDDTFRDNLSGMEAINIKQKGLKLVRLNRFRLNVEDADTLILERKGLSGIFSEDIHVRLAGIDAPEVAGHSFDPLEPVRYQQEQPGGLEAAEALRGILSEQDELSLVVSDKMTYGRHLGVVVGDDDLNINLELLRQGAVSALPFGPRREDLLQRDVAARVEQDAVLRREGMWSIARYQAEREANQQIGRTITHNTLTRLDKLARNLNLGAYASFLNAVGDRDRELTAWELSQSQRMGRALKKTHGPPPAPRFISGKDDAHNTIEALEHKGAAGVMRRAMTEFGSGYRGIFSLPRILAGTLGTTAITGSRQEVGKHIARSITAAEREGMAGGFIRRKLTQLKVTRQKKAFGRLLEDMKESPYQRQIILDPKAIKQEAKALKMSPQERAEMLVRHERVHQSVSLMKERGYQLPHMEVPKEFSEPFVAWRKEAGFHELSADKMLEEYIAHAAELSGRKNVPAHFQPALQFYEKQFKGLAKSMDPVAVPPATVIPGTKPTSIGLVGPAPIPPMAGKPKGGMAPPSPTHRLPQTKTSKGIDTDFDSPVNLFKTVHRAAAEMGKKSNKLFGRIMDRMKGYGGGGALSVNELKYMSNAEFRQWSQEAHKRIASKPKAPAPPEPPPSKNWMISPEEIEQIRRPDWVDWVKQSRAQKTAFKDAGKPAMDDMLAMLQRSEQELAKPSTLGKMSPASPSSLLSKTPGRVPQQGGPPPLSVARRKRFIREHRKAMVQRSQMANKPGRRHTGFAGSLVAQM